MTTCKEMVLLHYTGMVSSNDYWKRRHADACAYPRKGTEQGLWSLITGFAALADGYAAQTEGERLLGQDGYFWEHARAMIDAMRFYLNYDCGRFDCGTLDRLICELAKAAGVELED